MYGTPDGSLRTPHPLLRLFLIAQSTLDHSSLEFAYSPYHNLLRLSLQCGSFLERSITDSHSFDCYTQINFLALEQWWRGTGSLDRQQHNDICLANIIDDFNRIVVVFQSIFNCSPFSDVRSCCGSNNRRLEIAVNISSSYRSLRCKFVPPRQLPMRTPMRCC